MDVVLVACYDEINPVPGEDPCAEVADGELRRYTIGSAGPPCMSPIALYPEPPERCAPMISVVQWGKRDLQAVSDDLVRRFGGPYFVLPKPPPPGSPPGGGGDPPPSG